MGTGLLGEGLKVHGTNGCQYMLNEDWPRRGDATGDTYRCIQRGPAGDESVVAIKVARSTLDNTNSSSSQSTTFIPAAAWDQEVRLLRRLALLGGASSSIERNSGGDRSDMLGGAKTTTVTKSGMLCPPAYTIAMVTEFGGLKAMPSARFLVTVPVCWKTLDARVKGAERGYMETYTAEQALLWSWQIVRGLWTLAEADIGFRSFSLRNVMLTHPNGEVRLAGFDALLSSLEDKDMMEMGDGRMKDSRDGIWAVGRALHMTLTCSTDREDDDDYYRVGRPETTAAAASEGTGAAGGTTIAASSGTAGMLETSKRRSRWLMDASSPFPSSSSSGSGSVCPLLAAVPAAVRPVVRGLLADKPSHALPLGLALDCLAGLVGEDVGTEAVLARRAAGGAGSLRVLEKRWWCLLEHHHHQHHHQEQQQGLLQMLMEEDEEKNKESRSAKSEGGIGESQVLSGSVGGGGGEGGSRREDVDLGGREDEGLRALVEAYLDLGRTWEGRGKGYKAIELYWDAVALVGGESGGQGGLQQGWKRKVEKDALTRIADLYQEKGNHSKAKDVWWRLVKMHQVEVEACTGGAGRQRGQREQQEQEEQQKEEKLEQQQQQQQQRRQEKQETWRMTNIRQAQEAADGLANVRVRLAASLRILGKMKEALAQLNTAVHDLDKIGAGQESSMVGVLTEKAALLLESKDYTRALDMYEDALERRRKSVPRQDPELASLLVSMAGVYAEKGDTDVALGMLIQAYKQMATSPDSATAQATHTAVTSVKKAPASSSSTSSSSTTATASFSFSSSLSSPSSSPSSTSTSSSTSSTSSSTSTQSASPLSSRPTRRQGPGAGKELLLMANALERIGKLFIVKNQLDDALMCYKAAHERKATALARAHPAIAYSLACMAGIHEKRGDHRAAATMHARALEIRRAVLPPTSLDLASSLFGLANAHQRLRSSKSALLAYEEVETIWRINAHGTNNLVGLGDCLVNMSRPLKALGRETEAVAKLRDAGEVYFSAGLSKADVRVQTVISNLNTLKAYGQSKLFGETLISSHSSSRRRRSHPARLKAEVTNRRDVSIHHAHSSTTLGAPSQRLAQQPLPAKSNSFPILASQSSSMKCKSKGDSRPRGVEEAAGQNQQRCSIM